MILLFVLFLAGCVGTGDYNETLQNWVGISEENLYYHWGNPANVTYIAPHEKLVTYFQGETVPLDGNTEPYQGYEVNYQAVETPNYDAPGVASDNYFCRTTFTVSNGIITNFTFEGDDCVAPAE